MIVYLVAAGKGGCGKTTTTSMLARQLAETLHVAVLDLDTSGPNLPKMMGIYDLSPDVDMDYFYPKIGFNDVQVMSPAFLVPPGMACTWSGDKRMELIKEIIVKTKWDDCDVLLCDCPPGTGDEIIAVLETLQVAGVILVTTAKQESIDDATRAISLFSSERFKTPIICVVESMAYMTINGEDVPLFTDGIDVGDILQSDVVQIPYDAALAPHHYQNIADIVCQNMDVNND